MSWAEVDDLLIGDIPTSGVDTGRYLNAAADEITVRLGEIYSLPLPASADLPEHQRMLLRLIHSRLASGRLILSLALGEEQASLHAYGQSLVEWAYQQLGLIGTTIELEGATPYSTADESRAPGPVTSTSNSSFVNLSLAESPFDTYERFAHGLEDTNVDYWS